MRFGHRGSRADHVASDRERLGVDQTDARLALVDAAELLEERVRGVGGRGAGVDVAAGELDLGEDGERVAADRLDLDEDLDGALRRTLGVLERAALELEAGEVDEGATGAANVALRLEGRERDALEVKRLGPRAAPPEGEPEVLLRGGHDERQTEARAARQRLGEHRLGVGVGADLEVGVAEVAARDAAAPEIAGQLALGDRELVLAHALARIAEEARLDAARHVEGRERGGLNTWTAIGKGGRAREDLRAEREFAGPEERSRQTRERVDELGAAPDRLDGLEIAGERDEAIGVAERTADGGELAGGVAPPGAARAATARIASTHRP